MCHGLACTGKARSFILRVPRCITCAVTGERRRLFDYRRRFGCKVVEILLYSLFVLLNGGVLFAADDPSPTYAAQLHRQGDLWIGNWNAFDVGAASRVPYAHVNLAPRGSVVREDFVDHDGHEGQSFPIVDTGRNLWRQTRATNRGTRIEIEGKQQGLVPSGKNPKGESILGAQCPVKGNVREVAAKSVDNGETWEPWFDIVFGRGRVTGGETGRKPEDDSTNGQTVADLDTRYQQAVKQNDVITMSEILADDFILVTSSGKTYTKADLLEEAKSGRVSYEHQEDTDKTVRLWGDTAIVTAYLWEKGTDNGKPFEYKLWFSDVYRRTATGWRYVFAQSANRSCARVE
jgi:ketosteroid isomerase-like protein